MALTLKVSRKWPKALLAVPLIFAACTTGSPSQEPSVSAPSTSASAPASGVPAPSGEVIIWYDTGAAWSDLIATWESEFAQSNPDVKLNWVTQDAAQIGTKLTTALATNTGPDLVFAHISNLAPAESQLGAWQDLSPYLAADAELQEATNAIPEGIRGSFVGEDGKVWGSPSNAALVAFFVRTSWLEAVGEQAPESWADIQRIAKKFQDADLAGDGSTIGYCPVGDPTYDGALGQFAYWAYASGWTTPVIDADGKPSFNTDQAVKIAQFYYDLVHKDKVVSPDITTWTFKEFYPAVTEGKCGMGRLGSWNIPGWEATVPGIGTDFTAINLPPMTADQTEPNFQYQSTNGIALSAESQNKDAAVAFLKYFLSTPAQLAMYDSIGAAARFDMDWETLLEGNPRQEFFFTEEHDWVGALDTLPTFLPVGNVLAVHLNRMLGDASYLPEQAIANAYEEAKAKYTEVTGETLP